MACHAVTCGLTAEYHAIVIYRHDNRSLGMRMVRISRREGIHCPVLLIDQVRNGFSLEYYSKTPKKSQSEGTQNMKSLFTRLEIVSGRRQKVKKLNFYEVVSVLKKPENFSKKIDLKNFNLVKKGTLLGFSHKEPLVADRDFYPVFYGEKAYPNLICLQAIKGIQKRLRFYKLKI